MRLFDLYDIPNFETKDVDAPPYVAYDAIDRLNHAIQSGEPFMLEARDGTVVMCGPRDKVHALPEDYELERICRPKSG